MKEYLGDSVYVEDKGSYLILTTENGLPTDPSNKIELDNSVIEAFQRFLKSRKWSI